jgi:hypothetical protein
VEALNEVGLPFDGGHHVLQDLPGGTGRYGQDNRGQPFAVGGARTGGLNGGEDLAGALLGLHVDGANAGGEDGEVGAGPVGTGGVERVDDLGGEVEAGVAGADDAAAFLCFVGVGADDEEEGAPTEAG